MKERPILFSAAMVRAILAGMKTQTRRVVKLEGRDPSANTPGKHATIEPYTDGNGSWNFVLSATGHGCGDPFACPYGQPRDQQWVREAWCAQASYDEMPPRDMLTTANIRYEADGYQRIGTVENLNEPWGKLRQSIFMPRHMSRITLEVVSVRIERIGEISAADCWSEGVHHSPDVNPEHEYRELWEQINGPGSWALNPFVWCVSFKRLKP